MQQSETLIERLQNRLAGELPGIKSWERMAVKSQKGQSIESESLQKYSEWLTKEKMSVMKKAAVLIGLFQKKQDNIKFIFTERTTLSELFIYCLLYTSPSPRDLSTSRMPSSA